MKTHLDTIKHEGNLDPANRTRLSIDQESIAHIMSVLTDLYSDPALAVIREYSCNALDSHRAAGNPDPIQVTLPNIMTPTLVVKDQGVGLSVDEITNLFSKYGWSSKRDTDGEVGMLGLGCKSGLTYTSQFNLIAVKNGVKAAVLVTRDTDGVGALQVLDTRATDDHDGVEVQIPVANAASFNEKASLFFRFWEPGTVLVNGEQPDYIGSGQNKELPLDPDIVLARNLNTDYVVMGNVPYPVPHDHRLSISNTYRAVVRVPIGTVDFTPSREALHLTKRTKELLADARSYIEDATWYRAQEDITSKPTYWEAFLAARQWDEFRYMKGAHALKYRGQAIPEYLKTGIMLRWSCPLWATASFANSSQANTLSHGDVIKTVFITGHNGRRLTGPEKKRLQAFLMDKLGTKQESVAVILSPRRLATPWLDDAPVKHFRWEDVPRPEKVRETPKFRTLLSSSDLDDDDLPVTAAYVEVATANRYHPGSLTILGKCHVYVVTKAELPRLKKMLPHVVPAREILSERIKEFKESLTDTQTLAILYNREVRQLMRFGTILNPDLRIAQEVGNDDLAVVERWSSFKGINDWLSGQPLTINPGRRVRKFGKATVNTPRWMWSLSGHEAEEVMNAVYWYRRNAKRRNNKKG